MSIDSIRTMLSKMPDSSGKEILGKNINIIEKQLKKANDKYKKENEAKLTLSHLLTRVNSELQLSLENEKRFIASVSHELRTPLTAIIGYSELLDDTTLNNKQKRYLHSINQSSQHLLALISDLLDVAKLEDSRIELSLKEFDFDDMLNECASLIKSKINPNVEFTSNIPLLDYPIISDDKRLKQIFINLLSNAAKFTKKGSIRFYLKDIEELGDNQIRLIVNVDDTGDGIPNEVIDNLFDPFKSTDKTQGTGLGLYISQQLSNLMDGEITVETKQGVGSSFSVNVIVEKAKKKEAGKGLNGANIMIFANKDEFITKISQDFMSLKVNWQNFNIENSDITSLLVQMVVSGKFYDIAIFDMDIFKNYTSNIAGTLKAINPDIKIVALTKEDGENIFNEFDLTVTKPISHHKFLKAIENIYAKEFFGEEENLDYSKLDILIVEDVELNREYEKEMLNNFFGIDCDTAVNGKDALEKAKINQYDAILMDMRMPVMDGMEATREIRKFDKNIPIICMSANVYKEDKMEAYNSGMNDFIEKPLSKYDIENKLIKLLNNEFAQTENEEQSTTIEKEEVKEKIEEQEIDIKEVAINHLNSNFSNEISNKLYEKAIESINKNIEKLKVNLNKKDTKVLVDDFHILRGVCANIGLIDIAKKAGQLQKLAEDGEFLALESIAHQLINSLKPISN